LTSTLNQPREIKAATVHRLLSTVIGDVDVADVIVAGDLNLEGQDFAGRVTLKRCIFTGRVNLRYAHFHDVVELDDVTFGGDLDAESARFESDVRADGISLSAPAIKMFGNIVVSGDFIARRIKCNGVLNVNRPLSFNSARFQQSFEIGGEIDSGLDAISATVETGFTINQRSTIKGPVELDTIRVGGTLWLVDVTFGDRVKLTSALVGNQCYLTGSKFGKDLSCIGATISGHLLADKVDCAGRVRLVNMTIVRSTLIRHGSFGQRVDLDGTEFRGDIIVSASVFNEVLHVQGVTFAGARFGSSPDRNIMDPDVDHHSTSGATSIPGATFNDGATFIDTTWNTAASFADATFAGSVPECVAHIDDDGVVYGKGLRFAGCEFRGELALGHLTAQVLNLDWCTLARLLDVSSVSSLRVLGITRSAVDRVDFPGQARDLVGVRLDGASFKTATGDCKGIMDLLPAAEPDAIHTLEQAVRASGNTKLADTLAICEKRKERDRLWRAGSRARWALSWIYRVVANWGIKPWQLLLVLLLPLMGTSVFHGAGAVSVPSVSSSVGSTAAPTPTTIGLGDAALVSLDEFLPVDLARSKQYTPTHASERVVPGLPWRFPADGWATLLNVVGWLMVPLGVAVVSGMLRRSTN
jgi:hypothetical protein